MRQLITVRMFAALAITLSAGLSTVGCTANSDGAATDNGTPGATAARPRVAGATSSEPLRVAATTAAGPATIRLDQDLVRQALHRGELLVELADGTRYPVVMEREQPETGGRTTFIGKVRTPFGLQSAVLTFGPDAVFGVLPMPDGHALSIVTMHGRVQIAPAGGMVPRGIHLPTAMRDFVIPGKPNASAALAGAAANGPDFPRNRLVGESTPLATARVDVLGLYDQALVILRGSESAARTEVVNLVAITNQIHADSGTRVRVTLAGLRGIQVPEGLQNTDLLHLVADNLVEGVDVHRLRDEHGADLVFVARPYIEGDLTCGVGFQTAANNSREQLSSDSAYSVSSVDPCGPYVLAHELGHNMGSTHDFETASWTIDRVPVYGAYPFSFGYRQDGPPAFATVMAYTEGRPWIGNFSNPASDACGATCGVDKRADNVRSIDLMAERIAGFRGAPGTVSIIGSEGMESAAGDVSGIWLQVRATPPLPAEGVRLQVALVAGSGTATASVDYHSEPPSNIHMEPGRHESFATVFVIGDDEVEGDQTVELEIIWSNMPVEQGRAIATIVDDDPRPVLEGRVVFPEGYAPPTVAFPIEVRGAKGFVQDRQSIEVAPPDFSYAIPFVASSNISLNAFPPAPFAAAQLDLGQVDEGLMQDYPMAPGVTIKGRLRLLEAGPEPEFPLSLRFTESINTYGRPYRYMQLHSVGQEFSFQAVPGAWISLKVDAAEPYQPFLLAGRVNTDVVHDVTLSSLPTAILGGAWGLPSEGPNHSSVLVELSAPAPEAGVTLSYRTEPGTATAGVDFEQVSGTLAFAPGETVHSIEFMTYHDYLIEEDETFDVVIENIQGAFAPIPRISITIPDDDFAKPILSLRGDPPAVEGEGGIVNTFGIALELSEPAPEPVGVVYRTRDGSALAGEDYAEARGTLEFAPGETRHTIILQSVGDDDFEPDEDFYLVLDQVHGAIPAKESMRITLFNDDAAPAPPSQQPPPGPGTDPNGECGYLRRVPGQGIRTCR
ncbi:MAG: M12 family metallo-peptidase [Pseudomonadota bacterium]|nr:M12 family metallo-peptidase [Pseudomonadota bacterium]